MDQVVESGALVAFTCHARGNDVHMFINGNDPYPQSDYEARGYNFTYIEIPRPSNELEEHNNTIFVEARLSNNYTEISCTARENGPSDYAAGRLIIAGIL